MNAEILYQRNYPRESLPKMPHIKSKIQPNFSDFLKRIEISTELHPLPERIARREEFISCSIDASEIYGLDILVKQYDSHISVNYTFPCGGNMKYLKPVFTFADSFSFFIDAKTQELTVVLDYYTHSVTRNGRIIAP